MMVQYRRHWLRALSCGLVVGSLPWAASAQTGRSVLVVVNAASVESVQIGEYYAKKRQVPPNQVLRVGGLPADPPDGIDRPAYERSIQAPIAQWLARNQAQDRILFIVLTKGIPLRINGGKDNTAASVDSELAVLYLRMTGAKVDLAGPFPNPYFLGDRPLADARPFTRETHQIYLVTRLDGFTVEDVIGLIDRGNTPSRVGRVVLDGKASLTDKGNVWLRMAAERLRAAGLTAERVVFEDSAAVLTDQDDVLGYYSWGSNDPSIRVRRFGLKFQPGAIGGMFVSTDGRTFREPPADWALGTWSDKAKWFAGSPQSLAGDLIREEITGVAGHVSEPLLGNTIRPNILFPAYFAGFSLAEAFYLAMPSLSWMTVVVGDPLCAPFAVDTSSKLPDSAVDPATDLPSLLSARRLERLSALTVPREALQFFVRAESRMLHGDVAGARLGLEKATELAPTMLAAQYLLASTYEGAKDYDLAIARYRQILAVSPSEAVALNNLAYALAVHKGQLGEALPLAEKARRLQPRSGEVADTLGWIYFMSSDVARAAPLLNEAVTSSPGNAAIRLHLAQLNQALGNIQQALAELKKALAFDPTLTDRPEVKALQSKISP